MKNKPKLKRALLFLLDVGILTFTICTIVSMIAITHILITAAFG